jgi:hypothetical protein
MRKPVCISSKGMLACPSNASVIRIEDLNQVNLESVSFFAVDMSDWQVGYQQLQQIRSLSIRNIYLKPVLFQGISEDTPREVLNAADGIVKPGEADLEQEYNNWSTRFENINARIDTLEEISEKGDTNISYKVLRYIFTRGHEFKPIQSARNTRGYIYPLLEPLFPKQDQGVQETLEYLADQKLISGQYVSRVYNCTHCGCAFINFYETCPDCASSDLRIEELIHHFKCAYIGEMSDYKRGQNLVCPKCDKALKHIGVDYDKASVMYHCNSCQNVFQEPQVMTSCYNCLRITAPENQIVRDIKAYSITALGQNAAQHGMDSLLQIILESKVHAIPFDVFKIIFDLELARITRYKVSQSCLVILRLNPLENIYSILGNRSRDVFNELSDAFKASLRTSDVFSVKDENILLVIFTETTLEYAEIAVSRLKERILSLLTNNLKMDCSLLTKIHPLTVELDLDETIEKFLKSYV